MSTISIHVPQELIEGILPRLPVKDLLRFRCVCKSWCALIDHPSFIRTHYHHHYTLHKSEGAMPLFVWQRYPTTMCHLLGVDNVMLNITSELEHDTKLALNYPGDLNSCFIELRGIANGIVCLTLIHQFQDGRLNQYDLSWKLSCALWNPATRDVKILPDADVPNQVPYDCSGESFMTVIGFGFDHMSNDFKVLAHFRVECDGTSSECEDLDYDDCIYVSSAYEIYSLSTNSWKSLPYIAGLPGPSEMDACFNGVYYWTSTEESYHLTFRMISFNFITELFKISDPPQCADVPTNWLTCKFQYQIVLYKESLALIFERPLLDEGEAIVKVDIWVATKFDDEDFGIPLEWQCLFVIKPFPISPFIYWEIKPRIDGQLLFKTNDGYDTWSLYDPETHEIKNLGIRLFDRHFRYVASLFPISG